MNKNLNAFTQTVFDFLIQNLYVSFDSENVTCILSRLKTVSNSLDIQGGKKGGN